MSRTNKQKRKQAKQKARERRIAKAKNISQNRADPKFSLNVSVKGKMYYNIANFRSQADVDAHVAKTEASRQAGQEIHEAQIVDTATGAIVMKIPASPARDFKGTIEAPPVIAP